MSTKVILDTDIGDDIDDAVALAYLLNQPACELLGVTTVTECDNRRAALASMVCHAAGRTDVPIVPGATDPLVVPPGHRSAPQFDCIGDCDHATTFDEGDAVEFLRRTIRAHPGQVVLLAVGPMTNVGRLCRVDPEAVGMLRALVMMVGRFGAEHAASYPAEWNAKCDPHALALACGATTAQHRMVGLDVTLRVQMGRDDVLRRFTGAALDAVAELSAAWFDRRDQITFHDPLAAACVFAPDLCTWQRGRVDVECDTGVSGRTTFIADPAGRHEIAVDVQIDRFFEHYFQIAAK